MPDNFFALLDNDEVRRISLVQNIEGRIGGIFSSGTASLLKDKEPIEFDGNYAIEDDEILFVKLQLPPAFNDIPKNPIGIPILDITIDKIKALFWYDAGVYTFQNFDSRKLLQNKNILFYSKQTFDTLKENAFILENYVNAIYKDGSFFFQSYANANKIFNLSAFYKEATDEELILFSQHPLISIGDHQWFVSNSNSVVRKQVTLLRKSNILNGADPLKIKRSAKKFSIVLEVGKDGKIVFPKDKKMFKDILLFLNEQYYAGVITGTHYKTSSKRAV